MHIWVHIVNIMQWLWDQWRWSYHDSNINCSWHRWLNSVCMQCQARPCVVETHSLQTPISRRSDVWHERITLKLGTCHAPLIPSRVYLWKYYTCTHQHTLLYGIRPWIPEMSSACTSHVKIIHSEREEHTLIGMVKSVWNKERIKIWVRQPLGSNVTSCVGDA